MAPTQRVFLAAQLGHTGPMAAVTFSGNGMLIVSGGDNSARLWDAKTGDHLRKLDGLISEIICVACNFSSTRVAGGGYDRTVHVWDAETGATVHLLEGHTGAINSVAFSPDGTRRRAQPSARSRATVALSLASH